MNAFSGLLALCTACMLPALAFAQVATGLTIVPEKPRAMEPVYARIVSPSLYYPDIRSARTSMSGNAILVELSTINDLGRTRMDVMLGRLPAGHYTVKVVGPAFTELTGQFDVVPVDFGDPVAGRAPSANYSDLWWNPAQPGWGLSIAQGPTDELFAVWFVYDDAGRPTWYSLQPGFWVGPNSYSGSLFKTSGPVTPGSLAPSPMAVEKVGTAQLTFSDALHGQLDWTIGGVHQSTSIERQVIE